MGTYGTGVAVRTLDDSHPMAGATGFITNARGDVAENGETIEDGYCEVQFVFPGTDREGTTTVIETDALRVVGC